MTGQGARHRTRGYSRDVVFIQIQVKQSDINFNKAELGAQEWSDRNRSEINLAIKVQKDYAISQVLTIGVYYKFLEI